MPIEYCINSCEAVAVASGPVVAIGVALCGFAGHRGSAADDGVTPSNFFLRRLVRQGRTLLKFPINSLWEKRMRTKQVRRGSNCVSIWTGAVGGVLLSAAM